MKEVLLVDNMPPTVRKAHYFSLLMAAYNAEATIGRAIDSVLAQDFTDWELLIVNDGSTDQTGDIAQGYAAGDQRIIVVHQLNGGCGAARRRAQLEANADLLMKIDADDELEPNALSAMAIFIEQNPQYEIYSCNALKLTTDNKPRPYFMNPRYMSETTVTFEEMLVDCYILGGGSVMRRSALEAIGGYRAEARCEDYDVFVRALAAGARHRYTPQLLYRYHFDTPGHMNEDPIPGFASYIEILDHILAAAELTPDCCNFVIQARERFRQRTLPEFYNTHSIAIQTERQAQAVVGFITEWTGPFSPHVLRFLNRVKILVRPLRVALARRRASRVTPNS